MSRNEIRLRRQRSESASSRFRNYSEVMRRHERDMRIKEITRILVIFMFVVLMLLAFIYYLFKKKQENAPRPEPSQKTAIHSATYGQDLLTKL